LAEEREVGKVSHYFSKIGVAVIELADTLKVGDTIHIKGATSDFTQKVDSMQIEHVSVPEAKAGESIGMKVKDHVREHDQVFVVE
jgi:translation elongation factor EF-1alpha